MPFKVRTAFQHRSNSVLAPFERRLRTFEQRLGTVRTAFENRSNSVWEPFEQRLRTVRRSSNGVRTLIERCSNSVRTLLERRSNTVRTLLERRSNTVRTPFERRFFSYFNAISIRYVFPKRVTILFTMYTLKFLLVFTVAAERVLKWGGKEEPGHFAPKARKNREAGSMLHRKMF